MSGFLEAFDTLRPGMVVVLGVPYDEHSSFLRGAALAPARIRQALRSGSANLCAESGLDLGAEPRFRDLGDLELAGGAAALVQIEEAVAGLLDRGVRVLSLGGDVALMFASRRAFLIGLVLFLLTHIVYSLAFTALSGFHAADIVTGAILLGVGAAIFFYLRPGLGSMKIPVLLYILITCFMVSRAISTFFGDAFTTPQAWLISLGAVSFMVSDLVLAVNRFHHPIEAHRLSLFPYYLGQLLIALSPSYFG